MRISHSIFLFIFALFVKAQDYYKILGISRDASESEIKSAFRKLSLKFHPDKNPGDPSAAEKFVEVQNAYEILSDQEKRQVYDLQGQEGLDNMGKTDIFGQTMSRKGPNAKQTLSVTLEELYNGATKDFTIQRNVICKTCRGTGSHDGKLRTCKHCGGRGVVLQNVQMGIGFTVQMQAACEHCGGKGKMSLGNCHTCHGRKVVLEKKTLKINIEKGMADGTNIVFERESEQNPEYIPGDVIFKLSQTPHSTFKRISKNLYMEMKLNLKEAILGFKREVKHLDKHYTQISSDKVVQPFSVKVIKEEGMPVHNFPSQKGDLHCKFIISLPQKLSEKQKEIAAKIFSLNKK